MVPETPVLRFSPTAAHIIWDGVDVKYGSNAIFIEGGAHHLEIRNEVLDSGS